MTKTFLALTLFLLSPLAHSAWELNEVSFLLPLPSPANHLWGAETPAKKGLLLPHSVYQELPLLVVLRDREWLYKSLRVVAFRVDPCFREGRSENEKPCRRQLRFVWQPLEEIRGSWRALDAAVHTFHDLSDADWKALQEGLLQLRIRYPQEKGLALQVHPLLARQGLQSAYGRELAALVLGLVGPGNLTRATAMTVNTEGTVWVFTGFDLKDGVATRIAVPRTNHVAQAFFAQLDTPLEYRSTMNPFPQDEAPFLSLLKDSAAAEREMGAEGIREAVRSSLRALNPRLSNPGTIDCASCHAARGIPAWAAEKFPRWNWETLFGDVLFRGPGNLTDSTVQPRRTNLLRAFGYFGADPVISPRTVYETAVAAETMGE